MKYVIPAILVAVSVPAAAAPDARYDPNKVICKTTYATGSRLASERVCMTRKQWDEISQEAQKTHKNTIDKAVVREAFKG